MARCTHTRSRSIVRRANSIFEALESRQMMSGVPATFQDVGPLTGRQTVNDNVSTTQIVDSYRFQLPAAGSVNLLLGGLTHNANLHLLNSAGNEIGSSSVTGTGNDQVNAS